MAVLVTLNCYSRHGDIPMALDWLPEIICLVGLTEWGLILHKLSRKTECQQWVRKHTVKSCAACKQPQRGSSGISKLSGILAVRYNWPRLNFTGTWFASGHARWYDNLFKQR